MYMRVQLEGVEEPLFFGIAVQNSLRDECLLPRRAKVACGAWAAQGPVLEGRAVALLVAGERLVVLAPSDVLEGQSAPSGSSSSSSGGGSSSSSSSAEGGVAGAAPSVSGGGLGAASAEVVDEEEASDGDASDGEGEDPGRVTMHQETACAAAAASGRTPGHAGVLGAAWAVLAVVHAGAVGRWEPARRLLPGLPHSIREPSPAATSARSSLLVQQRLQEAWTNCRVTISLMEATGPTIFVQGVEGGGAAPGWSGEQLLGLSHGLQPERLQLVYGHLGQLAGAIGAQAGAVLRALAMGASGQVSHQELAGAACELQQQLDLVGHPQRQPPLERIARAWPHGDPTLASKRASMLEVLLGVGRVGAGGVGAAGEQPQPDDTVLLVRVGTGRVLLQRMLGGRIRPMRTLDKMLHSSSGGDLVALVDGSEVLLVPAHRLRFSQLCLRPAEARRLAVKPALLAPASLRPGAQLGLASAVGLVRDIVRDALVLALALNGCSFAVADAVGNGANACPGVHHPLGVAAVAAGLCTAAQLRTAIGHARAAHGSQGSGTGMHKAKVPAEAAARDEVVRAVIALGPGLKGLSAGHLDKHRNSTPEEQLHAMRRLGPDVAAAVDEGLAKWPEPVVVGWWSQVVLQTRLHHRAESAAKEAAAGAVVGAASSEAGSQPRRSKRSKGA